jgi:hypothetical protein
MGGGVHTRCVLYLFDRSDEAVSTFRKRFDEARILGRIVERFAQPINGLIQTLIEVDEGFFVPELLLQLISRYNLAGSLQQYCEDAKRLFRKLDLQPLFPQFALMQIDFKYSEPDQWISPSGRFVRYCSMHLS